MSRTCTIGVDIGTGSSKGVITDVMTDDVLSTATIAHDVQRPHPGWVEMDATIWWKVLSNPIVNIPPSMARFMTTTERYTSTAPLVYALATHQKKKETTHE